MAQLRTYKRKAEREAVSSFVI